MKAASIHLSELAINDILEQANWYESRSDARSLAIAKALGTCATASTFVKFAS